MDWDLILRFRDAGAKFARLPFFIGGFRVHRRQKTSTIFSEIGVSEIDRLRRRALGRAPSRVEIRLAIAPYVLRHRFTDLAWRLRNGAEGAL
jgi:hypothetical protein